jgi:hypothetical protein
MVNVEHARATLHFLSYFWWGLSAHSDKNSERWAHYCTEEGCGTFDFPTVHGELGTSGSSAPRLGACEVRRHTGLVNPENQLVFEVRADKPDSYWCSWRRQERVDVRFSGFVKPRYGWTGRGNSEKNGENARNGVDHS